MSKVFSREYWRNTKNFLVDYDHKRERNFIEKLTIIIPAVVVDLIYTFSVVALLTYFLRPDTLHKLSFTLWSLFTGKDILQQVELAVAGSFPVVFFFACLLAPFWEELAFRWYPLKTRLRERDETALDESKKKILTEIGQRPIYPVVILVCFIIFGLAHGGAINILLQGVTGLLMAYVYLRNGRCLWSAMLYHALFNGAILGFAILQGKSILMAVTMPIWALFLN